MNEPAPVHVLYHQGPCFVVFKPAGLLTQAPPGVDSLELRVKQWIKQAESKPGNVYLGVPHRLDRPVSGAVVLARHVRAARRLSEQFEARSVRKLYWAGVEGRVEGESGSWRDLVRKVPEQPRAEIVGTDEADSRLAVLHYRVLGRFDWGTWLELELETGRMHQVRLQAASRGHPVLGDEQYGASGRFGPACDDWRQRPIALHARGLALGHPMTHEPIAVTAPLPAFWRALELPLGEDAYLGAEAGEPP